MLVFSRWVCLLVVFCLKINQVTAQQSAEVTIAPSKDGETQTEASNFHDLQVTIGEAQTTDKSPDNYVTFATNVEDITIGAGSSLTDHGTDLFKNQNYKEDEPAKPPSEHGKGISMHKEEAELVRIETLLNRAHVEDEIIKLKSLVMIIKQRILLQKHAIAEEQLQDLQKKTEAAMAVLEGAIPFADTLGLSNAIHGDEIIEHKIQSIITKTTKHITALREQESKNKLQQEKLDDNKKNVGHQCEHLLSDIAKEQERLQVNKEIVQNLGKNAKEGIIDASIKSADNYAEIIAKSLDSVSVNQASVKSLDGMTNGITKDGKLSLAARRLAGDNPPMLSEEIIVPEHKPIEGLIGDSSKTTPSVLSEALKEVNKLQLAAEKLGGEKEVTSSEENNIPDIAPPDNDGAKMKVTSSEENIIPDIAPPDNDGAKMKVTSSEENIIPDIAPSDNDDSELNKERRRSAGSGIFSAFAANDHMRHVVWYITGGIIGGIVVVGALATLFMFTQKKNNKPLLPQHINDEGKNNEKKERSALWKIIKRRTRKRREEHKRSYPLSNLFKGIGPMMPEPATIFSAPTPVLCDFEKVALLSKDYNAYDPDEIPNYDHIDPEILRRYRARFPGDSDDEWDEMTYDYRKTILLGAEKAEMEDPERDRRLREYWESQWIEEWNDDGTPILPQESESDIELGNAGKKTQKAAGKRFKSKLRGLWKTVFHK